MAAAMASDAASCWRRWSENVLRSCSCAASGAARGAAAGSVGAAAGATGAATFELVLAPSHAPELSVAESTAPEGGLLSRRPSRSRCGSVKSGTGLGGP